MPTTASASMDQAIQLRGEGFVLRRWRADDLEAVLRHADDPQVRRGLSDRRAHPYMRADGEGLPHRP
ncbi:acetyltransferase [Xanthomonas oryzae]|uniref:acetyltransferase n=1 Tax=Xanthomonas oryzae TaxID=347 RepID=UPI003CCFF483